MMLLIKRSNKEFNSVTSNAHTLTYTMAGWFGISSFARIVSLAPEPKPTKTHSEESIDTTYS